MIRLVADENFKRKIIRGVLRVLPELDVVRVQDVGLEGIDDPALLEWAAREGRIVLTHDVSTMTGYAYDRVGRGLPMPGVWEVKQRARIARAVEDIMIAVSCSEEGEWEGQVLYLPL